MAFGAAVAAAAALTVLVLVIAAVGWLPRPPRAGFVSARAGAVHAAALAAFAGGEPGLAGFRAHARAVADGVDAADYAAVRRLWRAGALEPAQVERALA